jgi:hypothetical protein
MYLKTDFEMDFYYQLEKLDTVELERLRYYMRVQAQNGNEYSTLALRIMDDILLRRLATSLCECCLGRTGCDMCNPPQFDDQYYIDQDAHFQRFGRPAFPNEY